MRQKIRKTITKVKGINKRHLKHPLIIPLITVIVFFFLAMIIFINQSGTSVINTDSRVVELYDDGRQQTIPTTAPTVGDLLKRLSIQINSGDIVSPNQSTPILSNGFKINIYRVHPVTIKENGQNKVFLTANINPVVIAEQAGYQIYSQDYVNNISSTVELSQNIIGQVISIIPATPVNLNLYGTNVVVRTHVTTVGQLLSQNHIQTSNGNNVLPALTTPISTNMQILVVPVGQKLISIKQNIPFATQYVNDPNIPYDTTSVTQEGVDGLELIVESVVTKNGVSVNQQLQTVVINQPINKIISRGTGVSSINGGNNITWLRSSDIGSSDYQYVNYIMTRESHWNPDDINSRGCIGLGQFCNPANLTVPCPNWQVDAVCQLNAFNNYANRVYGTWANAATHEENYGWW
ncbi:MAG TPA: ubiquitin-like domain-containing protein [Candidatus Saccharimonadia bacterium]|nr:ubiquitin-like domain-containing protein [Candidatus Saccharimonadia bacterium]